MTTRPSADAATSADWTPRLVSGAAEPGPGTLWPRLREFHAWQAERWPRLASSLEAMAGVRTRELMLDDRAVTLQWNPGRVASTTARVDEASLRTRPCFLCPAQLPPEEAGLAFGDSLVLLANPAPIAPLHLAAVHRDHRPQRLEPVLSDAIALAVATAGHLTVFYNGPACGASAPDHVHLQAIESAHTPDERAVFRLLAAGDASSLGRPLGRQSDLGVWSLRSSHRALTVMRGSPEGMERGVRAAMDALAAVRGGAGEPPVNLLLRATGPQVTALVYPRGAHRPACYAADGDQRCLVSPGALDMAGLVITVRREDYDRLDASLLGGIYDETSLDPGQADRYDDELERRLGRG